jgi:DNA-binding protein H-NS
MDIWEALSQECREELVRVENDGLVDTVDNYLRKHRFCTECKAKVMRAYHLLVGEVDCNKEKGYCPALYEGLRCCSGDSAADRHVHVLCDTHYIATLIARAEPELAGSNRSERHAKTIDIAQEEVLTCIGLFLHDRLHKVWQKLRSEEQTWQILFFLGVKTLKKNLEIAMETNEGISQFELVCGEFEEEERVRQQKKMQKRQRKKQRQATKAKGGEIEVQIIEDDIEEEDVTKSGGCEDEAQPKKSSLCHPAVPPVQAVNPSHPDCSAGLHAGCTSCRHTDENDLHIQSCQNCQRLSKTNNNNTYKHNNNIVERDASKRLNGVHTREVPTEAWPLKNAKSILVTPPSPPSCSANLSFCNASPCFASPTCRDHGYFSGQESVCGTPCSSSEGSRSDDHHVGKQAVDGGNCNGCLELEKLNHHQNGRSCGGSGDGNHKHQGHHFHNKVPLKVKNINHQASSYNEGSGDGCRKSECNKSLSKSPLSFDEEEVEQASYCNGHSALNGDHNLSSVNLSGLSLEEMLEHGDEEANCEEEAGHDPPCGISQEDIDLFRLNKHQFEQQRQELRTKLKTQFLNMQLGSAPGSWTCTSCINGVEAQCEGKHDCDAPTDVHACHKDGADHATSGRGKVKVKSPKVKATAGAKPQPAGKVVHA